MMKLKLSICSSPRSAGCDPSRKPGSQHRDAINFLPKSRYQRDTEFLYPFFVNLFLEDSEVRVILRPILCVPHYVILLESECQDDLELVYRFISHGP